jgi:hypothetical protein
MWNAAKNLMISTLVGGLSVAALVVGCGGSSGSPGSTGSGGASGSGSGGAVGSGSGGRSPATCGWPTASVTSCDPGLDPDTNSTAPMNESLLSDFSPATWQNTAGKFGQCPAATHIGGALQTYQGSMATDGGVASIINKSIDMTNETFVLKGNVAAGDYGGGIMAFATCLNTSKYKGVKFKLGGSTSGCDLYLQVQTLSQQSDQYGGKCDHTVNTCFGFPKKLLTFDASAPLTVLFSELEGSGMPSAAADFTKEMIGLQWQFQASSSDCLDINMTIDDVSLVE